MTLKAVFNAYDLQLKSSLTAYVSLPGLDFKAYDFQLNLPLRKCMT